MKRIDILEDPLLHWNLNKKSASDLQQRILKLFLKYNLRALSYSTSLCGAPQDFILPDSKYYDVWDPESSDSEEET